MQEITVGKIYKHYKGNIYQIIGFAKCSETLEDLIIYKSTTSDDTWVRPRKMWSEIVDDKNTLRFTLIENNQGR